MEETKTTVDTTETKTTKKTTTTKKATTTKAKTSKPRNALILRDDVILNVQSTTFGRLVYINKQTGDKVVWEGENDIQQITVGNIREMKSRQNTFFKNYWIRIIGIESNEKDYQNRSVEEIYKSLTLQQYYENSMIDNKDLILNHTDDIPMYLDKMGDDFRKTLIIRCNDMIKDGSLDSNRKIKQLEKILDEELDGE